MNKPPVLSGLTPEQDLILAAISIDHAKDEHIRELLRGGLDWTNLVKIALGHGVALLLYVRLRAITEDLVAPAVMARLKSLYLTNTRRNLRLAQGLLKILDLLADQGVHALPLKGPALAIQAYGDIALRQSTDLDVLIHRQDFRLAYDILLKAGYIPPFPVTPREEKRLLRSGMELELRGQDAFLDVHWAINEAFWGFPVKTARFWQHLQTVQLNGRDVQVLSPENAILMLCVIGARDQWRQLKLVADVAHLVYAYADLDWVWLLDHAQRTGTRKILYLGLQLAEVIGGAPLPPKVRALVYADRLVRDRASQSQAQFFVAEGEAQPWDSFLQTRERLRDYLYYAFTPKPKDWQAVELPDLLYPLYYVIRPFRLLVAHGPRLFRSLTKR